MAATSQNTGDDYVLNRDWRAMARLNMRHMLFKMTHGYLLHPSVKLCSDSKIADIGSGTCIWPIDLLNDLSFNVEVDAIDISLAQSPPKPWLPEGIRTLAHDAFEPFPAHMVGKYDLVHIQNWLCIWRDESSERFIQNVTSLLKPGGYLQWNEQDPLANRIAVPPGCSVSADATHELMDLMNKPRADINFRWISALGDILRPHLNLLTYERRVVSEQHQSFWNVSVFETFVEMVANLARNDKTSNENTARLKEVEYKAATELLNGIGIHCELVIAVAQKHREYGGDPDM